jgi:hypothetical protein
MQKRRWSILAVMAWATPIFADCDLGLFREGCDVPAHILPIKPYVASLVYCRDTPLYVTKTQYDQISRYQDANINMDVMVNGEFVEGPCIPSLR